jgi:hypothetical protein
MATCPSSTTREPQPPLVAWGKLADKTQALLRRLCSKVLVTLPIPRITPPS